MTNICEQGREKWKGKEHFIFVFHKHDKNMILRALDHQYTSRNYTSFLFSFLFFFIANQIIFLPFK